MKVYSNYVRGILLVCFCNLAEIIVQYFTYLSVMYCKTALKYPIKIFTEILRNVIACCTGTIRNFILKIQVWLKHFQVYLLSLSRKSFGQIKQEFKEKN